MLTAVALVVALCGGAMAIDTPIAAAVNAGPLCEGYSACGVGPFSTHNYEHAMSPSYWGMTPGIECTNYVAFVESTLYGAPTPNYALGNAANWATAAKAHGVTVNQTPTVGSVAQWNAGDTGISKDGHVAIVEQVGPDDSYIVISQDNWSSDAPSLYGWALILNNTPGQGEIWPDNFIHFPTTTGTRTLSATQPARLIQSTGNLYWTANQAVNGSSQAEVVRASKGNVPGQERILYRESTSTPVQFDAITYANVGGTYYGYFVANYPSKNESQIMRVPLAGGAAVPLATSPAYIGSRDLVTDGSVLYWADATGIRSMAIAGGTIQSLASGATFAHLGLDGSVLYYSSANSILRVTTSVVPPTALSASSILRVPPGGVPTSGGGSISVVSAASAITALYPPSATNGNVYWGEANGSVFSLSPGNSPNQLQAPRSGVSVSSVSVAADEILWGQCVPTSAAIDDCQIVGLQGDIFSSVPASDPPVDVQGDSGAWYWGDSALEKFTLGAVATPPQSLSLSASGNVLAHLRKPRTLVLLIYSVRKPSAQHLNLLGRVALGHHRAGRSQIHWGLRLDRHRLRAGRYIAELEARIDGALTTGGPTVLFDVGLTGKVRVVARSCPSRARANARAATVC